LDVGCGGLVTGDRLASLRGTKPAYPLGNLLNALKAEDKEGEVGLDEVFGKKRDNANWR